ncbi:MAG: hypothetical protein ACKODP_08780 [Actinomycetota bacterium]
MGNLAAQATLAHQRAESWILERAVGQADKPGERVTQLALEGGGK